MGCSKAFATQRVGLVFVLAISPEMKNVAETETIMPGRVLAASLVSQQMSLCRLPSHQPELTSGSVSGPLLPCWCHRMVCEWATLQRAATFKAAAVT